MKNMKQIKKLVLIATISAAAGGSLGDTFTIGSDKSDFALAESWAGGVAPGAGDFVSFAVDGFYGPFTLSKDVTYQRFMSGGWARFDSINGNAAQQFDLCGHTMTLTGYRAGDGYLFDPCNSGPRNHFVFSNGKIAIGQSGNVTIGWQSCYNSQVRLSGIELAGVATLNVGYGGSYNCELKIDGGSVVSSSRMELSQHGVGENSSTPNRLLVDNAKLSVSDYFKLHSGGVIELTQGAELSAPSFQSGLLAGSSKTFISNSTLVATAAYETAKAEGSEDYVELSGESAVLKAKQILSGNHPLAVASVLAHDGAVVEGTERFCVGNEGPATMIISNATVKSAALDVGASENAAGSVLRICGDDGLLEAGGMLTVGTKAKTGCRFEVSDRATGNIKRLFLFGANTIKVADATLNISHGDSYHTSLVVGTAGAVGGQLILSGAAPKINFTHAASKGGVKMLPGTKIVYELPPTPYETAPLDTYWLHIQPDAGMPNQPLAEIAIDLSCVPTSHDRLVYKLLHVQDVLGGVNAIHADAIARVNNLPEIKAAGGRLEWKETDLVFTLPSNRGLRMTVR